MATPEDFGLRKDFILPIPSLTTTSSSGITYVSFARACPRIMRLLRSLPEDEYPLEEVELSAGGDYLVPSYASFGSEWDRMKGGPSVINLGAAVDRLKATCDLIIEVLALEPLGGTESPTSSSVHTLSSGLVTGGGGKVLVQSRMTFS
ncbi:Coatomer subunit gamma [Mycena indigotica]|uniref:Coatomer subunit gamma n=1 Tax=Mycena indigotica TaxID=2126181 RepID=A0A8H6SCS4_9AGAR|nr:Coatomer subunit gamma [Mycena indigotica]KAF7297049.1 Coatomer subunit gamma [Mycena indigotica]